jgi:hypothetical protein
MTLEAKQGKACKNVITKVTLRWSTDVLKTKQIGKSQLFFLVFWEKAALVYKGNK